MDSMTAFLMGQAAQGNEPMVFDWDKAAEIIRESKPEVAAAGLRDDWGYTGGEIYVDGEIVPAEDTYTYLASNWAVPELELDHIVQPCFKLQSEVPDWGSGTYWPDSAREILKNG